MQYSKAPDLHQKFDIKNMNKTKKNNFMSKALKQATLALKYNEVPIGAVVIDAEGLVIGRGYNKIETNQSQLAHAEVRAIAQACRKIESWRLIGCIIYVTLEPCLMCLGLIKLSRLKGVVYGAKSHLFGAFTCDSENLSFYTKGLSIEGGVKEQESIDLLQAFFKQVRKMRRVKP